MEEFRPIAVHDRANGFEGGANSIWLKGSDSAKNPGRDELLNRVLKELPDDETGAGLVVILRDPGPADSHKYHVIQVLAEPEVLYDGFIRTKKHDRSDLMVRQKVEESRQ